MPRLELFVINTSPTGESRLGAYAIVPELAVAAVASFHPHDESTRSWRHLEFAGRTAVNAILANCHHGSESVSVRVLEQESERRNQYSRERFLGSIRLAHWHVQEQVPDAFNGALIALYASAGVVTVGQVGEHVSLHRVRGERIERLDADAACVTPLGAAGEVEVFAREERLGVGDIFVLSSLREFGERLADSFARQAGSFEPALVSCMRSGPPMFRGVVGRWWE